MYLKEKPYNLGLRWLLIIVWDTLCMFGVAALVFSKINEWLITFIIIITCGTFIMGAKYINNIVGVK